MIRRLPRRAVCAAAALLITVLPSSNVQAWQAPDNRDEAHTHAAGAEQPDHHHMQEGVFTRVQVSDRVWALYGRGGNIGVIVTDDGVVVIDTQFEDIAPGAVEQIRAITDRPIRYIINTHVHGDHVGGNAVLQQYGDVIAHQNTFDRMMAGRDDGGLPGRGEGLPQVTFQDEMRFYLGGVEIQAFHLGRAHTDTDVVVWMPGENVVHTGDLVFNGSVPYVDKRNGAHTGGWVSFLGDVMQRVNPDARVIPGHGEVTGIEGMQTQARYFRAVQRAVSEAYTAGKSREEILAMGLAPLGEVFAGLEGDSRLGMSYGAVYTEVYGNGPTLLVVNKSENTLAFVDVETGDIRGKVTTGPNPHEVAATPDGKLAYVTNYGSGRPRGTRSWLTVVDVESMRVVRDLEFKDPDSGEYLSAPHGIMVTPDGRDLWVTAEGSQAVARIALSDESVAGVYMTGQRTSHQVVPLPDGSKAYVANIGSGSVSVVDVRTGSVNTVVCAPGTEGIDVSPDGRWVWATNRADDSISVIDTRTDRVTATIRTGSFPIRVKFTPDGAYALVSNAQDGEVAVFNASTRDLVRTVNTGAMPIGLLILPDGSRAYAANTASDMVSVIDLEAWKVIGTLATGDEPDGLALAIIKR